MVHGYTLSVECKGDFDGEGVGEDEGCSETEVQSGTKGVTKIITIWSI